MKKLTGLDSVSGVHAVAEMEVTQESNLHDTAQPLHRLLVLEQLQDPGNMVMRAKLPTPLIACPCRPP